MHLKRNIFISLDIKQYSTKKARIVLGEAKGRLKAPKLNQIVFSHFDLLKVKKLNATRRRDPAKVFRQWWLSVN